MAIVKGIYVNNNLNSYCITDARMVHNTGAYPGLLGGRYSEQGRSQELKKVDPSLPCIIPLLE